MGSSVCAVVSRRVLLGWFAALAVFVTLKLRAGGSGLNTVVVINQASSNSCQLGNYYCQERDVPPQNVLYINWTNGNTLWASDDLQTNLITPLLDMLADRDLTNQIQYIVLSMDIPFETSDGSTADGTTSALFYGLRVGDGTDPLGTTNSYAASEGIFSQNTPLVGAPGYSFLTTMITGDTLAQAEQLVDQGVASDGTFPQQPVVLAKSSDTARNVRYPFFDNAIFNVNLLGVSTILRTNTDSVLWPGGCMGFETGLANFTVPDGMFVPGAMADSLTSFGGVIFGSNSQTSEFAFIDGGVAGSYGTVSEPDNDTQKFPNPQVYFYQARGFSLAESYYQSINEPFLGLIVGEPLAAPFAQPGNGQWGTNLISPVLTGTTNLTVNFNARARNHPLEQVDLFVDGVYYTTLTNDFPAAGNQLTASLNGYPVTYTVPTNATLSTIAAGLAAQINAVTTATGIAATSYGDRVQLEYTASNPATAPFYVADNLPATSPGVSYGVNYLPASFSPPMAVSVNRSGALTLQAGIPSTLPYVVLASTNLSDWEPIVTNDVPGLFNFTDWDSTNYPARFYRMAWPNPNQPLQVSGPEFTGSGFQMSVDGVSGEAWAVQTSTDLVNWISVFTNQAGGTMNFIDASATNAISASRFYRASHLSPPAPVVSVVGVAANVTLVSVSNASLPFTVSVSTNPGQWTPLATNFAIGQIQTSASSAQGTAGSLSTFLNAAQPQFVASQALGMQSYLVISNTPTNGWMQFTFTETNGEVVTIGITNQPQSPESSVALATRMYDAINTNLVLQGSGGVEAEDFVPSLGFISFNLYARNPGLAAAQVQVQSASGGKIYMSAPQGPLTGNLSNLEPRNHLFVKAGANRLALTFPFATTNFPDGYHELTAVAYEGSNVRTETQTTLPVQIQNSTLSATLALDGVTNSMVSVDDSFQVQVTVNTNNVSLITLYSMGGAFATATNESAAAFQVAGTNFWEGVYPFYAIVQTSSGLQYRTQTQWITITP
ncbi:MAG TPA: TIGR03790 family protein [Candidatus Sulfotelmatobacter sp.]|nr:TIGR03790 family protein [Candidatus Sulfotelmatobacter sp.]